MLEKHYEELQKKYNEQEDKIKAIEKSLQDQAADHRTELADQAAAHKTELDAQKAAHDLVVASMQQDIKALNDRI